MLVSIPCVTEFPFDPWVYFRGIESALVLPQSSKKRQWLVISAALCAESSLLAYVAGYLLMAKLLGAGSSAALSWFSAISKFDDPRLARDVALRTIVALALILMTATTLVPRLRRVRLIDGLAGSSRTPSPAYVDRQTGKSGQPTTESTQPSATDSHDAYSGIVLWTNKPKHTRLIAPLPISWNQKSVNKQRSNPLVIPFDGVYWFFRGPDVEPPPKSRQAEGSPEMFNIHSTDWRPLSMQAHQNLGSLIRLDCCGRIQVAIRNADRYPTSISLELILVDTTAPGKPSQSLGRQEIISNRRWSPDVRPEPTTETLDFLVPSNSAIHRFDEITIVFRLDGFRARAAARIGIDHFTLVPRGL